MKDVDKLLKSRYVQACNDLLGDGSNRDSIGPGLVPGRSVGLRRWFVRLWCYLFVRRLAIKPSTSIHYDPSGATEHFDETYRFEWQKMPKGWRWF